MGDTEPIFPIPPDHAAAVEKAVGLFRMFLSSRPMDEAQTAAVHLKQMILSDPGSGAVGWIMGVRRQKACAVLLRIASKGGG